MESKSLKIFVIENIGVGRVDYQGKKLRVVRKFPLIQRFFSVLSLVFVGGKILSRPPTFGFKDLFLQANYF